MNNNFGISDNSFKLLVDTLAEFDCIDSAVIFGSRAKGDFKKGSDIDIAVFGDRLTEKDVMTLEGKLNETIPIPYCVDVVATKFIDHENLIDHIERVGIVFYKKSTKK